LPFDLIRKDKVIKIYKISCAKSSIGHLNKKIIFKKLKSLRSYSATKGKKGLRITLMLLI
jgi:hypothetical protein